MKKAFLMFILILFLSLASFFYAQSYYDAQCMKLDFYGAHITVDGVFCKRQMGKTLIDYKLLNDCIKEKQDFELKQINPNFKWMEG